MYLYCGVVAKYAVWNVWNIALLVLFTLVTVIIVCYHFFYKRLNMLHCHVIYEETSPLHKCTIRPLCSASWRKILTDDVKLISVCKMYSFGITLTCRHAGETVMYSSTPLLPLAHVVLTFRRRIKSRLPFAGIIRRLPYSTRFQDKG